MKKEYNNLKYTRVQRLLSLRIAKEHRKISHEALCIIKGITPINFKVEQAVAVHNKTIGINIQSKQIDKKRTQSTDCTLRTKLKLMTTLTKQLMTEKTVNAAFRYTQTAAKVNAE